MKPPTGWSTAVALIVTSVLVTACGTTDGGPVQEAEPAPQARSGPAEPAPEVAALPPAPDIDDNPDQLIGLDPDGLFDLLGRPELVRRESPAQIWQYRGAACVLDVVLYEEGGDNRVTYVEARDSHGAAGDPRPCLNELLRSRLSASRG